MVKGHILFYAISFKNTQNVYQYSFIPALYRKIQIKTKGFINVRGQNSKIDIAVGSVIVTHDSNMHYRFSIDRLMYKWYLNKMKLGSFKCSEHIEKWDGPYHSFLSVTLKIW